MTFMRVARATALCGALAATQVVSASLDGAALDSGIAEAVQISLADSNNDGDATWEAEELSTLRARWASMMGVEPTDLSLGQGILDESATTALVHSWIWQSYPKVELHVHGDGAIDEEAVWEIAKFRHMKLPDDVKQASDLAKYMTCPPKACPSLTDFLAKFNFFLPFVAGSKRAAHLMGQRFVARQAAANVIYSEFRFAPELLIGAHARLHALVQKHTPDAADHELRLLKSISSEAVVDAAWAGLKVGMEDMRAKTSLPIHIRILLCCMRGPDPETCTTTVNLAHKLKSAGNAGVVGIDLAGDEIKYPNDPYVPHYQRAKALGLHRTVHSGETGPHGPRDCELALTTMHAERIGHGYKCLGSPKAMELLTSTRTHLEACPTSSVGTGSVAALNLSHPIHTYQTKNWNFGLNTDDPAVLVTNMTHEMIVGQSKLGLRVSTLKQTVQNAAHAIFAEDSLKQQIPLLVEAWWAQFVSRLPAREGVVEAIVV